MTVKKELISHQILGKWLQLWIVCTSQNLWHRQELGMNVCILSMLPLLGSSTLNWNSYWFITPQQNSPLILKHTAVCVCVFNFASEFGPPLNPEHLCKALWGRYYYLLEKLSPCFASIPNPDLHTPRFSRPELTTHLCQNSSVPASKPHCCPISLSCEEICSVYRLWCPDVWINLRPSNSFSHVIQIRLDPRPPEV